VYTENKVVIFFPSKLQGPLKHNHVSQMSLQPRLSKDALDGHEWSASRHGHLISDRRTPIAFRIGD